MAREAVQTIPAINLATGATMGVAPHCGRVDMIEAEAKEFAALLTAERGRSRLGGLDG